MKIKCIRPGWHASGTAPRLTAERLYKVVEGSKYSDFVAVINNNGSVTKCCSSRFKWEINRLEGRT